MSGAAKNLYVGNLPFQTTEEDLMQLFGQYGSVVKVQITRWRDALRILKGSLVFPLHVSPSVFELLHCFFMRSAL